MKQNIEIDQLMADTWLTVTLLKQGATTQDGAALYESCCVQVERVRKALQQAGCDEASIEHVSYAQCALLDEVVMSRKSAEMGEGSDTGQAAWRRVPLQARFFGTLHAGEALWDRVAEVLRQPAANPAVLTCYHRVITLGFQGVYGLESVSQSQRDAVISALTARVPPLDPEMSLVVHRGAKHRYSLRRSVWFWVVTAILITGIAWWGGHLWLQSLLAAHIPELSR